MTVEITEEELEAAKKFVEACSIDLAEKLVGYMQINGIKPSIMMASLVQAQLRINKATDDLNPTPPGGQTLMDLYFQVVDDYRRQIQGPKH